MVCEDKLRFILSEFWQDIRPCKGKLRSSRVGTEFWVGLVFLGRVGSPCRSGQVGYAASPHGDGAEDVSGGRRAFPLLLSISGGCVWLRPPLPIGGRALSLSSSSVPVVQLIMLASTVVEPFYNDENSAESS
ncbi:hypothetical protein CRG98_023003 [Punica granatum]|uniref:Uncharacterized protein n=1 Tax=Punica granatum TaxID=22663 RepID=A0A2I0JL21_PUNGR|nr:hypothetical protein CRG98_023003 [Punica granatum]